MDKVKKGHDHNHFLFAAEAAAINLRDPGLWATGNLGTANHHELKRIAKSGKLTGHKIA